MRIHNLLIACLIVAGLLAATLACGSTPTPPPTYEVKYRVTGTAARASLTYETPSGTEQQQKVKLPWYITFDATLGQFAYLSAQNEGESGNVIVEILVDGLPWKKATSSGAYSIASCSGSVGRE